MNGGGGGGISFTEGKIFQSLMQDYRVNLFVAIFIENSQ